MRWLKREGIAAAGAKPDGAAMGHQALAIHVRRHCRRLADTQIAYFLSPGATAFKRDIPDTELHFYDTRHLALETHITEIREAMLDFLGRKVRG
ncbi:hypothetical protein [Sphingomonas sp. PAMC 26605]|uniref:hypothetical protein n=1 Tax=Sphingomonas sp. PAMC 26605 TaxID=1112214 RepID=UPI00026CB5D4|nr:hypothetical protein [Sphingomonas sp. PAMC 26605]